MPGKKNSIMITAAIIIVVLVLMFTSALFLSSIFEIKDGEVMIPSSLTTTTTTNTTTTSEETTPDELTFKGTFNWEEKDGARAEDKSTCYLRINTIEGVDMAKFSFGEYLNDGWPVYLVSHTGNRYIFESSERSLVERVRIIVDVTETKMSGTVENITPDISNFVRGSFKGEPISFEMYAAEVLN